MSLCFSEQSNDDTWWISSLGILLSHSAVSAQQWRAQTYKQASALQDGWYKENAGGRGKGKSKRCTMVVRKKKSNFKIYQDRTLENLYVGSSSAQFRNLQKSTFRREYLQKRLGGGKERRPLSHIVSSQLTLGKKMLKNWVLQDLNHKALRSAMHVCITSCRRKLWTATVTFLNRTVHVRELF